MLVLLTRPAPESAALADQLVAMGHQPVVAPLLRIVDTPDALPPLAGVQAVLVTSANGVRALARRLPGRDLPVLAVGPASAAAATAAGYRVLGTGPGDGQGLARLAATVLRPERGPLLHAAGEEIAVDLAALLAPAGFTVHRSVLYRAEAEAVLPAPARGFLAAGPDGNAPGRAVLLFSPRSARLFVRLTAEAGLLSRLAEILALALSPAVAEGLRGARFAEVRVAAHPDPAALLACLPPAAARRQEA